MIGITGGVGEILQQAREQRGLSIESIAEYLKIRSFYLKALEAGSYEDLPGTVYATGFLKSYADFLQLNAEELISMYKLEARGITKRQEFPVPVQMHSTHAPKMAIVIGSLVLALGAFMVVNFQRADELSAPIIQPPPPQMLVEAQATAWEKFQTCEAGAGSCIPVCPDIQLSNVEISRIYCDLSFKEYVEIVLSSE